MLIAMHHFVREKFDVQIYNFLNLQRFVLCEQQSYFLSYIFPLASPPTFLHTCQPMLGEHL